MDFGGYDAIALELSHDTRRFVGEVFGRPFEAFAKIGPYFTQLRRSREVATPVV